MKKLMLMLLLSGVIVQGLDGAAAGAGHGGGAGGAWVRGYGPDAENQRCGSCNAILPSDDGGVVMQECGHNLCQSCVTGGKECGRYHLRRSKRIAEAAQDTKSVRVATDAPASRRRAVAGADGAPVVAMKHCDKCGQDVAENLFAAHTDGYGKYACVDTECGICSNPLGDSTDNGPVIVRSECGHAFHRDCAHKGSLPRLLADGSVHPGFICIGCNLLNPNPSRTLLQEIEAGNLEGVQACLNAVPVEQRAAFVQMQDDTGETALHEAAWYGHVEVVRALLDAVPDAEQKAAFVQMQDHAGETAVHLAAWRGHEAVVRALLDAVPDAEQKAAFVQMRNNNGLSALDLTVVRGHEAIVRALLAARHDAEQRLALVQMRNDTGWTALQWAARGGDEAIGALLAPYAVSGAEAAAGGAPVVEPEVGE